MAKPVWGKKATRADEVEKTAEPGKKEEYIVIPASEMLPMPMAPQVVEVVENTIYFYADIDRDNILKLNKTLHELTNTILWRAQIQRSAPCEIYLHINSLGGSIFDAFSAVDSIINSKVSINTVIDGAAASAATLLSIAGHKRYIKPHARFLIHQLSSVMWGKYSEFQDEISNLDRTMDMLRDYYKKYTKIKMSTLNEILKHDLWFSAKEAIQLGLADCVWE